MKLSIAAARPTRTGYRIHMSRVTQARNIIDLDVWQKELERYLRDQREGVQEWINSVFRKWAIKSGPVNPAKLDANKLPKDSPSWLSDAVKRGDDLFSFDYPKLLQTLGPIVDYLRSIPEDKDLSRMSVPDTEKAAKVWHDKMLSDKVGREDGVLVEEGTQVVMKFTNGYTMRKLSSAQALNREGEIMGHCVGSYADDVMADRLHIYSLRDAKNVPHVTFEVSSRREVTQIKGTANEDVIPKYHDYCLKFLAKEGFPIVSMDGLNLKFSVLVDAYKAAGTFKAAGKQARPNVLKLKNGSEIAFSEVKDQQIPSEDGGKELTTAMLMHKGRPVYRFVKNNFGAIGLTAWLKTASPGKRQIVMRALADLAFEGGMEQATAAQSECLEARLPKFGTGYYSAPTKADEPALAELRKLAPSIELNAQTRMQRVGSALAQGYLLDTSLPRNSVRWIITSNDDKRTLLAEVGGQGLLRVVTGKAAALPLIAAALPEMLKRLPAEAEQFDSFIYYADKNTREVQALLSAKAPKGKAQPQNPAHDPVKLRNAISKFVGDEWGDPKSKAVIAKLKNTNGAAQTLAVMKQNKLGTSGYLYTYMDSLFYLLYAGKDVALPVLQKSPGMKKLFLAFTINVNSLMAGAFARRASEWMPSYHIVNSAMPTIMPLTAKEIQALAASPAAEKRLLKYYKVG